MCAPNTSLGYAVSLALAKKVPKTRHAAVEYDVKLLLPASTFPLAVAR